jgi:hypothetical protein
MMATTPVWYGDVIGASHTTIIDNPLGGTSATDPLKRPFLAATMAFLRWLLADDQTMKSLFVGSSCGFCRQTMTSKVQEKNLQKFSADQRRLHDFSIDEPIKPSIRGAAEPAED